MVTHRRLEGGDWRHGFAMKSDVLISCITKNISLDFAVISSDTLER